MTNTQHGGNLSDPTQMCSVELLALRCTLGYVSGGKPSARRPSFTIRVADSRLVSFASSGGGRGGWGACGRKEEKKGEREEREVGRGRGRDREGSVR